MKRNEQRFQKPDPAALPNVLSTRPYPVDKICRRCEARTKKAARWKCRSCGRFTCEHLCAFKDKSGIATCSPCLLRGAK